MSSAFRLAWRHLCHYPGRTAVLVLCLALTMTLPLSLRSLIADFQTQLRERAEATPLVIGAPGSQLDLAISTLYFDADPPEPLTMATVDYVNETGFALAIPLHLRYRARGFRVVGTTLDYFSFRKSSLAEGKPLSRLGDCVIGSEVARSLGLKPGDRLLSDPENVFDLAGSYPLNMRVRGILAPSSSPDDRAVFVDLRSAWIIEGIGHGHQELAEETDQNLVLDRDDRSVTASAAVLPYTEITDENLASFHFHGTPSEFPVTSVIAVPHDEKSSLLLTGRFTSKDSPARIIVPSRVVEELLGIVVRIKRFFDAASWLIAGITAILFGLVSLLTQQLRKRERETMFKLGCSRRMTFRLEVAEWLCIFAAGLFLALGLTALVQLFGPDMLQHLLIQG